MVDHDTTDIAYIIGHEDRELRRLELQAAVFAPTTSNTLRAAGLAPGMSVLDIGTGAGDVALLAADMVGPTGSVVSIDREEKAIERGRVRAEAAGLAARMTFEASSLEALAAGRRFDFVVGRFVLSWQTDQIAFLAHAAALAKPGGTVHFIEPGFLDLHEVARRWSNPIVPLYDEVGTLLIRAFQVVGYRMETGANFVQSFMAARLPEPTLTLEQVVGGSMSPQIELLCMTLESFMPALEGPGIARADALDFPTLATRVRRAVAAARAQVWGVNMMAAWAKVR